MKGLRILNTLKKPCPHWPQKSEGDNNHWQEKTNGKEGVYEADTKYGLANF